MVGGLLSAHLLAGRAGMELEPGWPCSGPLLRMAEDAARKLLPGNKHSAVLFYQDKCSVNVEYFRCKRAIFSLKRSPHLSVLVIHVRRAPGFQNIQK